MVFKIAEREGAKKYSPPRETTKSAIDAIRQNARREMREVNMPLVNVIISEVLSGLRNLVVFGWPPF
jgi:hypothetical protein